MEELYERITRKLIAKNLTITTMESITSGLIASCITDTEGASTVMKGAFVTYSNEAKIINGVPESVIDEFGVYSKETARAMAFAAQKVYDTDISIGVTGTAGNVDPANEDSIPGLVYFSIVYKDRVFDYEAVIEVEVSRANFKKIVAEKVGRKLEIILLQLEEQGL